MNKLALIRLSGLLLGFSANGQAQSLKTTLKPRGDPKSWLVDEIGQMTMSHGPGTATVSFHAGTDGRIDSCVVTSAGSNDMLGDSMCRGLTKRARFVVGEAGTGTYTAKLAE